MRVKYRGAKGIVSVAIVGMGRGIVMLCGRYEEGIGLKAMV